MRTTQIATLTSSFSIFSRPTKRSRSMFRMYARHSFLKLSVNTHLSSDSGLCASSDALQRCPRSSRRVQRLSPGSRSTWCQHAPVGRVGCAHEPSLAPRQSIARKTIEEGKSLSKTKKANPRERSHSCSHSKGCS